MYLRNSYRTNYFTSYSKQKKNMRWNREYSQRSRGNNISGHEHPHESAIAKPPTCLKVLLLDINNKNLTEYCWYMALSS